MKTQLAMMALGAFLVAGAVTPSSAAENVTKNNETVYSLTKACAKGKVRRRGRCVSCPKGTHANRARTKCYWNKKRATSRGSHAMPKPKVNRGSY